jgi:hypothetical protein
LATNRSSADGPPQNEVDAQAWRFPRKTFQTGGSSSGLARRKKRPTRLTRGSRRILWYFAGSSALPITTSRPGHRAGAGRRCSQAAQNG